MKKSFLFSLIVVVSLMLIAQAGYADVTDLISDGGGGAGDDIGDVTILNDATTLSIVVELDPNAVVEYYDETDLILEATLDDLEITEAHIHVATEVGDIPQTGSGNPKPGKFEYKHEDTDVLVAISVDKQTATLEIDSPGIAGTTIYIAVHIAVEGTHTDLTGEDPVVTDGEESAWGKGTGFSGKNWAMYISYIIQAPLAPGRAPTTTYWGAIKAR